MMTTITLQTLPYLALEGIISHLGGADLCALRATCRALEYLSRDHLIRQPICFAYSERDLNNLLSFLRSPLIADSLQRCPVVTVVLCHPLLYDMDKVEQRAPPMFAHTKAAYLVDHREQQWNNHLSLARSQLLFGQSSDRRQILGRTMKHFAGKDVKLHFLSQVPPEAICFDHRILANAPPMINLDCRNHMSAEQNFEAVPFSLLTIEIFHLTLYHNIRIRSIVSHGCAVHPHVPLQIRYGVFKYLTLLRAGKAPCFEPLEVLSVNIDNRRHARVAHTSAQRNTTRFCSAQKNLRVLALQFDSVQNMFDQSPRAVRSALLPSLRLDHLETFVLCRAVLHHPDLYSFLERHKTLRNIKLLAIGLSSANTWPAIFRKLAELPALQSLELRLIHDGLHGNGGYTFSTGPCDGLNAHHALLKPGSNAQDFFAALIANYRRVHCCSPSIYGDEMATMVSQISI